LRKERLAGRGVRESTGKIRRDAESRRKCQSHSDRLESRRKPLIGLRENKIPDFHVCCPEVMPKTGRSRCRKKRAASRPRKRNAKAKEGKMKWIRTSESIGRNENNAGAK